MVCFLRCSLAKANRPYLQKLNLNEFIISNSKNYVNSFYLIKINDINKNKIFNV